jgi:hypothetical protein
MWREEYRKNNGDVPRIKTTTDADWIAENGTDQVDIASKQFRDLPRDWRKENKDAATAATKIVARRAAAGLGTSSRKDIDEMSALTTPTPKAVTSTFHSTNSPRSKRTKTEHK